MDTESTDRPKQSATSLNELSLDKQLKSNIENLNNKREELEKKLVKEKVELENSIKESSSNFSVVSSKVQELRVELQIGKDSNLYRKNLSK
ncbi:MAG: hypothetical protein ACW967_07010 [Candidatus Hodarchaeales archaeon]